MKSRNAKFRLYGNSPRKIVLLHGGPGAQGSLSPFAERLSHSAGIIEHLQSGHSIDELLMEIEEIIDAESRPPVYIAGHSWGAWLGILFASARPDLVKKLILIGCAPPDREYEPMVERERDSRLTADERMRVDEFRKTFPFMDAEHKEEAFLEFSLLMTKIDSWRPGSVMNDLSEYDYQSFEEIWPPALELRNQGSLLSSCSDIKCPVTAVHGSYDPHPAEGVKMLSRIIKDFRFVSLDKCGHYPWSETLASDEFYSVMLRELDL